jgi:hypothetical protein
MSFTSSCPKCQRQVTVPDGVAADLLVRCPLCEAEYPMSEALATAPPALVVVGAAAVPESAIPPIPMTAEPAIPPIPLHAAMAAPTVADEDFVPLAEMSAEHFTDHIPLEGETAEGVAADDGGWTAGWHDDVPHIGGNGHAAAATEEDEDTGAVDFAAITGIMPGASAAEGKTVALPPPKKRKRRQVSPVRLVIGMAISGLLAVLVLDVLACYFLGPKNDFLYIAKYLPGIKMPPEAARKPSNGNGAQQQAKTDETLAAAAQPGPDLADNTQQPAAPDAKPDAVAPTPDMAEPKADTAEPKADAAPKLDLTEPKLATEPETKPEPRLEPAPEKPKTKEAAVPDPFDIVEKPAPSSAQPDALPKGVGDLRPEAKSDPFVPAKPNFEPLVTPDMKPDIKPEVTPQSKPDEKLIPPLEPEPTPPAKLEVKPEAKPEVKPETIPTVKVEPTPEAKPIVEPPVSLGPRQRPSYDMAALTAAVKTAQEALGKSPTDVTPAAYENVRRLAETVTFVKGPAGGKELEDQKQAVRAMVQQIAQSPDTASKFAAMAKPLLDGKNGTGGGIVLCGVVTGVRVKDGLYGAAVRLDPDSPAVGVVSDQPLGVEKDDRVVVVGSVVADPAKNVAGYTGSQPVVIWAGMMVKSPQ